MSNKPAPRCPGCGKEMEMRWQSYYGGIASMWYACDCGWRSPNGDDEIEAYAKVMKRYKPVYDDYQGTAHEQGWPDQRAQTLHGGGELNFDVPPGRYPMVCQSTRETEEGHVAGQWISVEDELPKEEGKYIVCTERGSVYCTRFYKGGGCEGIFKTDINTHITYWMPLPEAPKEGE